MNNPITVQYAMMCLQELDDTAKALSPQDISRRQGIPLTECEGILNRLELAGLVDSPTKEQFVLAKPIQEFKVLDILEALWAPQKKETTFKILFQAGKPALRKTLEAVSSARSLASYPSDGTTPRGSN